MDLDTFIVAVYCLVDDLMEELLGGQRLRKRGPDPTLDDREVLTVE
nr:IS982 family transposase [Rubrobacter sp.]